MLDKLKARLIDDWHRQLNRLWTVKLALASALLGVLHQVNVIDVLNQVVPQLQGYVPQGTFAWLSIGTAVATAIARIVKQQPA